MKYTIKASATRYKGVMFRSRLEARWASFFSIVGWRWQYEPLDLPGWSPDFLIDLEVDEHAGRRKIRLLCEVKPYADVNHFEGHQCAREGNGHPSFRCDSCIGLGLNPNVCWLYLESASGNSVGSVPLHDLIDRPVNCFDRPDLAMRLWAKAGNRVQWKFNDAGKRTR